MYEIKQIETFLLCSVPIFALLLYNEIHVLETISLPCFFDVVRTCINQLCLELILICVEIIYP